MNHQISSSSTTTTRPNGEDLPEDLILEIFSHLPPISLLRFKSISKTFHSLISNPNFLCRNTVHRYRLRLDPSPPPCILLNRQDFPEHPIIPIFRRNTVHRFRSRIELKRLQDFPIIPIFRRLPGGLFYGFMIHGDGDEESDDDDHQHYYYGYSAQLLQNLNDYQPEHDQPESNEKVEFILIDSCNGLLLYLNYAITYIIHRGYHRRGKCILYVCNPITKDCIKLPTFEEEEQQAEFKILDYSSANIVFDPSISLTYKVVIWLACRYNYLPEKKKEEEEEEEEHYRLYVYSSETRSWRLSYLGTSWKLSVSTIDYILLNQFNYEFRAVLLKGVLYWSTLMGWHWLNVSLCYDVEKDLVWTLKLPKKPVEYERQELLYFGVCGGSLRLIENYYNRNGKPDNFPSSLDVMELNHLQLQQQQQWTVKYRVNIGEEGYYANYIRKRSLSDVSILDLYKTTMKEGEGEGEEMLLCINNHSLVISFNLSNNTFGKELRNETGGSLWFTNVL